MAGDLGAVVTSARARVSHFASSAEQVDRIDLVAVMSLLVVLLHSPDVPTSALRLLVIAGLLVQPIRRSPWLWLAVTVLRLVTQMPDGWSSIDNHQYLITWWTLALAFGLWTRDPEWTLRRAARLLIGLCFAFAVLWKVLSAEFLDGTFLSWTLVKDERFAAFSGAFLGLPDGASEANREALSAMQAGELDGPLVVQTGSRVLAAGVVMAWWTVLIELAVAVCYLSPLRLRPAHLASVMLAIFVLTVYPVAAVVGFAWILIAMSVPAALRTERGWPIAAVTLFIVVLGFPAAAFVFDAVGRLVG